jgi:alpha-glucosidase
MMQFSVAPWRVLDSIHLEAVRKATGIRIWFAPVILRLAKASALSGEPVARAMEYVFPGNDYAMVRDQFMLGDSILVAPLLNKGTGNRSIIIPPGKWEGDDGSVIKGPATITTGVAIDRLPYFRRVR